MAVKISIASWNVLAKSVDDQPTLLNDWLVRTEPNKERFDIYAVGLQEVTHPKKDDPAALDEAPYVAWEKRLLQVLSNEESEMILLKSAKSTRIGVALYVFASRGSSIKITNVQSSEVSSSFKGPLSQPNIILYASYLLSGSGKGRGNQNGSRYDLNLLCHLPPASVRRML